jgi:SAM-dependent methyltransferase
MDPAELLKIAGQFRLSQAIYAAAELGVADRLVGGELSAAELAAAVSADVEMLRRLMRALSSEGVFAEYEDGRFGLAPAGRMLVSGTGTREMVLGWTVFPPTYEAFGKLADSVRTDRNAFELAYGKDFHHYLGDNQRAARAYDAATAETVEAFEEVVKAYDFGDIETIVDIGGGTGNLLSAILRQHPGARGVLFDLPAVVSGIEEGQLPDDVEGRVTIVPGDFFRDPIPPGDAYVLATVVRLFDDDLAAQLLMRIRAAMKDGGRVVLMDFVHPPGPLVAPYGLADLSAMAVYGGRDRSAVEFAKLFETAGLRCTRVVETGEVHSWVEAVSA